MKILVTGAAGFIGYHLCKFLLQNKVKVVGIDIIDLKKKSIFYDRLKILKKNKYFTYKKIDISKYNALNKIFLNNKFSVVINLAAEAGVRNSIENPEKFLNSNIIGFYNILHLSKEYKISHLIFASSSSVYGDASEFPTSEKANISKPISFYASTKTTNELMAFSYSQMYNLKITGLRFFTVYGPFGRPDMAIFKFFRNTINGKKINLFNQGQHTRDFTYVDDVITDIFSIIRERNNQTKNFNIFNIGGGSTTSLNALLKMIEKITEIKIKKNYIKKQQGDVIKTHCDNTKIIKKFRKNKYTDLYSGLVSFYEWYKQHYK